MGRAPIPREKLRDEQRCTAHTRAGKRCSNPRQTGLRVCHQHGGATARSRRRTRHVKAERAAWALLAAANLWTQTATRYGRQPAADRAAGMVNGLAVVLGMPETRLRACLTGEIRCATGTLESIAACLGLAMEQAWTADYLAASPANDEG